MIAKENLTGVVLAGGHSSRFGSNKALYAHIEGDSFLLRAIRLLQPLCSTILISGYNKKYEDCGCKQIEDKYKECGPLAGIHATLDACTTDYALYLTCDMPLMELTPLLRMLVAPSAPIVGWIPQEKVGGIFPILISKGLVSDIENELIIGNHSIRHSLCNKPDSQMLSIPEEWIAQFTNINQKEDLQNIFYRKQ